MQHLSRAFKLLGALLGGLAMLAATSLPAAAQPDTRTPIEAYQGDVLATIYLCSLKFKLSNLRSGSTATPDSDYVACISDGKKTFKTRYDAALKTVKKSAAKAALKEHYITAVSAISGIYPENDEIVMSYNRRQTELSTRLTENWTRFEVEN